MAHSLEAAFVLPLTLITLSGALLYSPKILRVERSDARQLVCMAESRCNADVLYGKPAYQAREVYERMENPRYVRASPRRLIEGIRVAGDLWRLAREKDETIDIGPPVLPLPPGQKPSFPRLGPGETIPALPAGDDMSHPALPPGLPYPALPSWQGGTGQDLYSSGFGEVEDSSSGGRP